MPASTPAIVSVSFFGNAIRILDKRNTRHGVKGFHQRSLFFHYHTGALGDDEVHAFLSTYIGQSFMLGITLSQPSLWYDECIGKIFGGNSQNNI